MIGRMLSAVGGEKPKVLPEDLEGLLIFLQQFGKPRCGVYASNGWHTNVEMTVASVGTSFEVMSDFGMASPLAATKQCAERLLKTLRDLGASP